MLTRCGVLGALAAALGAGALPAQAGPVFLATHGRTLYRTTPDGPVETFTLSDEVIGLAVRPDGAIIATSSSPTGGGSTFEMYQLQGELGDSPTLAPLTTTLVGLYSAIEFIGDTYYGFRGGTDDLYTIDPTDFSEELVGSTGLGSLRAGGAGYDPATDTLYMGNNLTDSLYTVDYNPGPKADPVATLIGSFSVDTFLHGFDFSDGTLYAAATESESGRFILGSIDVQSGLFSPIQVLDDEPTGTAVGIVVIPAPGSAMALLGVAGLAPFRRRRR